MKVAMAVVYVYLAVILGGAFIALIYVRAQDRGWPSVVVFFVALAVVLGVQTFRTWQRRQSGDREGDTNG